MKPKLALPIIFFSLFITCFGPAHKLMPGYGKAEFRNGRLGVILIKKNIQIGNEDDFRQVLGRGDPADLFYSFFSGEFPADMLAVSRFGKVSFSAGADDALASGPQRNSDGRVDMTVSLPPSKRFVSDTLDFLMIIDLVNITREMNSGAPVQGSEGGFRGLSGGMDNLACSASFALWDNRRGTVAAYGQIREKIPVAGELTKETFALLLKALARSLCSGMPY